MREAAHAQRQAVPFLPDFTGYLNHETIRHLFGDAPARRRRTGPQLHAPLLHRCRSQLRPVQRPYPF
ncbi:hypothetical protein LP420_38160 [Massilia sp. B-10]|nr:hypothetical protein LP420_38160 [Massilia sp. B-10]UUZ54099.1 hypothetical protein LP419_37640 [Massilia sp. H-1]